MKEFWTNLLHILGRAWWVEIVTDAPRCTYYFGPFSSAASAEVAKSGYIEDLEQEGAQGIQVIVKRCKPECLTVDEDMTGKGAFGSSPVFSN